MTNDELQRLLISRAIDYSEAGIIQSVVRNAHRNGYPRYLCSEDAHMVVNDFLNFVLMQSGMDLALSPKDWRVGK